MGWYKGCVLISIEEVIFPFLTKYVKLIIAFKSTLLHPSNKRSTEQRATQEVVGEIQ